MRSKLFTSNNNNNITMNKTTSNINNNFTTSKITLPTCSSLNNTYKLCSPWKATSLCGSTTLPQYLYYTLTNHYSFFCFLPSFTLLPHPPIHPSSINLSPIHPSSINLLPIHHQPIIHIFSGKTTHTLPHLLSIHHALSDPLVS